MTDTGVDVDVPDDKVEKLKLKDRVKNIKVAIRRSGPAERLGIIIMVIMALIIISMLASFLLSGSKDKKDKSIGESKVEAFNVTRKDNTESILEDTESVQGRLVYQAELAKNAAAEAAGKSTFLKLTTNSTEYSPYGQVENGEEGQGQAKDVIKVRKREDTATVKTDNNQSIDDNSLDEDVFKALINREDTPKSKSPYAPEGQANIYLGDQLKRDPLAGLSRQQYQTEMGQRVGKHQASIKAALAQGDSEFKTSAGIVMIASTETDGGAGGNAFAGGQSDRGKGSGQNDKDTPPMLLAPGESIVVSLEYDVDSRVPGPFIMNGYAKPFKDAAFRCTWSDNGDFLVPNCNEITMLGKTGKMEAMVINPKTMGRIVDQDVDDDLLFKSIARISANLISTWGVEKLKTGAKVVINDATGTVSQENTLSDRDLFLGAAASSVSDFNSAAENYYQSPSVKTIKAGSTMILVMTRPLPDWWGIKKEQRNEW